MKLTGRQRAFVDAFAAGGISAKDAAIKAGYSAKTADVKGGQLRRHPAVAAELARLHGEIRERVKYDAEAAMQRADELMRAAEAAGQYGPAVKALEQKNKLAGLLIDRQEITTNVPDVAAVIAAMQERRALVAMRSQALTHDAEYTVISDTCDDKARDKQSIAPLPATVPDGTVR